MSGGHSAPNRAIPGLPIFAWIWAFISFSVISLRLYTRLYLKRVAGWDDALIAPALFFALGWDGGLMFQIFKGGYGHHVWDLDFQQVIFSWKSNAAENILSMASAFFSRASIIALLLRLLGKIKYWKYGLYFALILNFAAFAGTSVTFGVNCVPIEKLWNPSVKGWCVEPFTFNRTVQAFAALNAIVDCICAIIPFLAIRNLQIENQVKLGLYALLCCGIITAACGIGRLVSINFDTIDKPWDLIPCSYWTATEIHGAAILASLPGLHQMVLYVRASGTLRRVKEFAAKRPSPQYSTKTGSNKLDGSASRLPPPNAILRTTDMYTELDDLPSERSQYNYKEQFQMRSAD